ncbi:MAG: GyrI-like domain-containing protein [Acidimicrobiia bacterium]
MQLHETDREEQEFVGVRENVKRDEIGLFFDRALPQIFSFLGGAGLEPTGPPLGVYYSVTDDGFDMAAAVPVGKPIEGSGAVISGTLPGGRAVTQDHYGQYDGLSASWDLFNRRVDEAGLHRRFPSWEEYVIGPPDEADVSRWKTVLVQPIV